MQRAQAILVVLVLFAAPLALLARASGSGSECGNLCCLPHGSHAAQLHDARPSSRAEGMVCHHKDGKQAAFCAMKAGHHPPNFGFLAPLVPTTPSAVASLILPIPARTAIARSNALSYSGFPFAPFEPPRS